MVVYSTSVDNRDTDTPLVHHRDVGYDVAQRFAAFEHDNGKELHCRH